MLSTRDASLGLLTACYVHARNYPQDERVSAGIKKKKSKEPGVSLEFKTKK